MKCQKCNNPATFHITEMTDDEPLELHFCEKHANEYLHKEPDSSSSSVPAFQNSKGDKEEESESLSLEEATQELKDLDFQACPICGAGFQDFRKTARLGCPNDYHCFAEQLEPLIKGIHGFTEHLGKRPCNGSVGTKDQLFLLRLRREMEEAVSSEDYERASRIRDKIKSLENV